MKLNLNCIFKVFIVLMVFIVCAFNKIYAVDEVYYGIVKYDENGNKQLWYRIMVTPDVGTENKLLTKYSYNTWITDSYLQSGTRVRATSSTYVTPYSIYTWEKIGEYSAGDTSHYHYGYVKYSGINGTYNLNSLTEFADIKNWLNGVGRSRVSVWVKDRGDYVYSFTDKKNGTTRLSDVVYKGDTSNSEYNNNIIDIGGENLYLKLGYAYLDASYADDYAWALINYPTDNFFVKSAVTFNRERLYLFNSNATKNTASYIDGTILIEDVSLTTEQTEKLLEAINNKKANEIYVSSIFEFKRQVGNNTGTYYYAVSPTGVVHSRGANTAYNWTANMLGTTGTGEYSMLNEVDNKIIISSVESTERNIQINHVYVDKSGSEVKYNKIATQNYTTLYANGKAITALDNVTNTSTTYLEKYIIKGNEKTTNFNVKTLNNVTLGNLIDEANNVLVNGAYKVTGYNITIGDDINTLESNNNLSTKYNKKTVYSSGDISFNLENNKDVVIDVFYEVPTTSVEVINYCFKSDGKSGYYIEGNGYGEYDNKEKIYATTINTSTFVESYNNLTTLKKISFANSTNISLDDYIYLGYETGNSASISNTNVSNKDAICSITGNSNTSVKIIFKFKEKEDITPPIIDPPEIEEIIKSPTKNINGRLTTTSAIGISTSCTDTKNSKSYTSYPTNAVNNSNDIYVGIQNNPKYIVSGINVEKQNSGHRKFTIYVNMTYGNDSRNWTLEIPYYFSFYAIQNLLIYKYDYANIYNTGSYNTGSKYDTSGSILFASPADDERKIRPKFTIDEFKLSSSKGDIKNDISEINNWKNYITTYYSTNVNFYVSRFDPSTLEGYQEESTRLKEYIKMPHTGTVTTSASIKKYTLGNLISVSNNTVDTFTNITPEGNTTVDITLVKSAIFNKVAYGNNQETIDTSDLKDYSDKTQESYKAWQNKVTIKEDKYKIYTEAVAVQEEKQEAYDAAKKDYDTNSAAAATAKERLDAATKSWNAKEPPRPNLIDTREMEKDLEDMMAMAKTDADQASVEKASAMLKDIIAQNELEKNKYDAHENWLKSQPQYTTEEADAIVAAETAKEVLDKADKELRDAKTATQNALDEYNDAAREETAAYNKYSNAFDAEVTANNYYDEVKYIQDKYWNVYKNYSNSDIAELIGLKVKFTYSSSAASLGGVALISTSQQTTEVNLISSEEFENDKVKEINIEASRQKLTDTQKKYYTTGFGEISGINNVYYSGNTFTIPLTRLNGIRTLAGEAVYNINAKINVGGTSAGIYDNMYYDTTKAENNKTVITKFVASTKTYVKSFGVSQNNSDSFNIYTPLVVSTELKIVDDDPIVNQDITTTTDGASVLQLNTRFTINFSSPYNTEVYDNNKSDFTKRYTNEYYIKFNYEVSEVSFKGASGTVYQSRVPRDTWIGPIYGDSITAMPMLSSSNYNEDSVYHYYVLSVAKNIQTTDWTNQVLKYYSESLKDITDQDLLNKLYNACGYEGKAKISYYADEQKDVVIINRMYDFRVTDLKDLDWEDIFRQSKTSLGSVNSHTSAAYYSGMYRWNVESLIKNNEIVTRTSDQVGTSVQRVLPLGAYKNTDSTYVNAPKMGYRFSFDFKVTGSDNTNKSATITTKFYYISKDGETFYEEYSSGKKGIYLFYKNSSGQYVRVGSNSDTYKIQYTPNDGYRLLTDYDISNLSSKLISIGSLRELTLNYSTSTTRDNGLASITYYGEYKLPNSTIAVLVDENGKYDINKPLTDGYLGVVFDIQSNEVNNTTLSYSTNDKSLSNNMNSSQWDYEGYLGISEKYIGMDYSTSLKLEKGTWQITNVTYNKIKGTVILYDLDRRASNDFN